MIRFDVEVYEKWGDSEFAQARFLVHGYQDVLWTNSPKDAAAFAAAFIEESLMEFMGGSDVDTQLAEILESDDWLACDDSVKQQAIERIKALFGVAK